MGYSNEEILIGIMERESKVFVFLYDEYFDMIRSYIRNHSGTETEAEDIFQDTIIIIFEKINSGQLKLTSSFKTYFFAICKNLWKQRLHFIQRMNTEELTEETWNALLGEEEFHEFEEEKLFLYHFNRLDEDCKQVLLSFFDKTPYRKIASDLNFTTSYIKKLKFKCKDKLYRSIIKDPIYHELRDQRIKKSCNQKFKITD